MGNQQSNENTRQRNYKICRITSIDTHSDWIRCYLDDYVPYNNGEREYMDFKTDTTLNFLEGACDLFSLAPDVPRQATLSRGQYIVVDTDYTREHGSGHNFSRRDVRNVNVESSVSFPGEGGLQGLVADIAEIRELRASANEWSDFDKQMQQAWQLQPPKK
jgi:hypothetical protein